eukprot:GGOE01000477.1.p1 GENE.GGOE01000477.1~~GGOE01000477.1.p1  ORF type:complete len:618 (-),score=183.79 GGOE01000477.1:149-2002(-)
MVTSEKAKLSVLFLQRFLRLIRLAVTSGADVWLLLALPLSVALSIAAGYVVVLVPGRMYKNLLSDDWHALRTDLLWFLLVVLCATITKVLRTVLGELLSNKWRRNITLALHRQYAEGDAYFTLQAQRGDLDNPDQRLVTDVRLFCQEVALLWGGMEGTGGILEGVGNIGWYSYETWHRSGGFGVGIAFAWSALVSMGNSAVINVVAPRVLAQERLEASFRYLHVQWRDHAEEIAFQDGGATEQHLVDNKLRSAVSNTNQIIARRSMLHIVQFGFSYYSTAMMYATVAMAVALGISGGAEGADRALFISQFMGILLNLIWGFTILVELGPRMSDVIAYTTRVAQLAEALEELELDHPPFSESPHSDIPDTAPLLSPYSPDRDREAALVNSPFIRAVDLEVRLPTGELLLRSVTFTVRPGDRLLIVGPAGCGKTSLLRILKGLWPVTGGQLDRPASGDVFFLPQRPHLPGNANLGTLMTYPAEYLPQYDEELLKLVGQLGLQHVVLRAGSLQALVEDWEQLLSGGEVQRVCVARALWRRPAFIVIDESTSNMDLATEELVYQLLLKLDAGIISVGHRPSLRQYHRLALDLSADVAVMQPLAQSDSPNAAPVSDAFEGLS